jgi:hypothetical protein
MEVGYWKRTSGFKKLYPEKPFSSIRIAECGLKTAADSKLPISGF